MYKFDFSGDPGGMPGAMSLDEGIVRGASHVSNVAMAHGTARAFAAHPTAIAGLGVPPRRAPLCEAALLRSLSLASWSEV